MKYGKLLLTIALAFALGMFTGVKISSNNCHRANEVKPAVDHLSIVTNGDTIGKYDSYIITREYEGTGSYVYDIENMRTQYGGDQLSMEEVDTILSGRELTGKQSVNEKL